MAQPYVGEIRMFAGNFPPVGWMFCNGQPLPVSEYETLYTLIGTTYGGDGQSFNLPNLQSRIPIHQGSGGGGSYVLAEPGGVESVTLTSQQIPVHSHPLLASNDIPTVASPHSALPGQAAHKIYRTGAPTVFLNPASVTPAGGSQPHENCQPFLCVDYIISLFGLFPSPT